MASVQAFRFESGLTLYLNIRRRSDGYVWEGTTSDAFESWAVGDVGDYDIPLTETPASSGYYIKDIEADPPNFGAAAAGIYDEYVHLQAGGSPAGGDVVIGFKELIWTGSTEVQPYDSSGRVDVGEWLGTAVTTSSTSAKPEVDVNSVSDNAATANNLETVFDSATVATNMDDFFDGTGYAGGTIKLETDVQEIDGTAARATDLAEIAQYLIANSAEPLTDYVADDSLYAKMVAKSGDISDYDDTTDSLEAIGENVISVFTSVGTVTSGQIVALDSAPATIGGMLNKMASDTADGSTFDAATDSLEALVAKAASALTDIGLDHLVSASVTGTDIADNSIIAKLVSKQSTADWDDFANTTDSLQAIRDRGDTSWVTSSVQNAGAGAITFTYTLTSSVDASVIADADVWATSDVGGSTVVASGRTDQNGQVVFYLDAGTVYIWRQKTGWNFTNPDQETVA